MVLRCLLVLLPLLSSCAILRGSLDSSSLGRTINDAVKDGERQAQNVKQRCDEVAAQGLGPQGEAALGLSISSVVTRDLVATPPASQARATGRRVDPGAWVRQVGVTLAAKLPPAPWTFTLVTSSQKRVFAAPGGHVIVTSGFLETVSDESQLALALTHVMAHEGRGHWRGLTADVRRARCVAGQSVVVAARTAAQGSSVQVVNPGAGAPDDALALAVLERFRADGFTHLEELQADQSALNDALAAGWDPRPFPALLPHLEERSGAVTGPQREPAAQRTLAGLQLPPGFKALDLRATLPSSR